MGLFDGPVVKFAQKFCEHLDACMEARFKKSLECDDKGDQWGRMKNAIVGEAIGEISDALKTVAEL